MKTPGQLIYVCGNNGVGKTTVTGLLARACHGRALLSGAAQLSYCADIHRDPRRFAFEAQVAFLVTKVARIKQLTERHRLVMVDRSPHEDVAVFARYWHEAGCIDDRAFETYGRLADILLGGLPHSSAAVYLHASVPLLKRRILGRLRPHERRYKDDFLEKIQCLYGRWQRGRYRMVDPISINMDRIDFLGVDGPAHIEALRRQILNRI